MRALALMVLLISGCATVTEDDLVQAFKLGCQYAKPKQRVPGVWGVPVKDFQKECQDQAERYVYGDWQ